MINKARRKKVVAKLGWRHYRHEYADRKKDVFQSPRQNTYATVDWIDCTIEIERYLPDGSFVKGRKLCFDSDNLNSDEIVDMVIEHVRDAYGT